LLKGELILYSDILLYVYNQIGITFTDNLVKKIDVTKIKINKKTYDVIMKKIRIKFKTFLDGNLKSETKLTTMLMLDGPSVREDQIEPIIFLDGWIELELEEGD